MRCIRDVVLTSTARNGGLMRVLLKTVELPSFALVWTTLHACLGFRDNNLAELRQQLAVFFAFFP